VLGTITGSFSGTVNMPMAACQSSLEERNLLRWRGERLLRNSARSVCYLPKAWKQEMFICACTAFVLRKAWAVVPFSVFFIIVFIYVSACVSPAGPCVNAPNGTTVILYPSFEPAGDSSAGVKIVPDWSINCDWSKPESPPLVCLKGLRMTVLCMRVS